MAKYLIKLKDFEIVIVCDDSGSMTTEFSHSRHTRWDELRSIVKKILRISVIFDKNGVDIYFLNREGFSRVKNPRDIDREFECLPTGFTPLVRVLTEVFNSALARTGRDKKLLVFVATDGEPTDDRGNPNVPELERLMNEIRNIETSYVTFLLCTDDPASVRYLNAWDRNMIHVDVVRDFLSEREEIRHRQGMNFPFSQGDYIVKALVGAIDPDIDSLNE